MTLAFGSAFFGADRLTGDCCPPVFSQRLYLTWLSHSHKARHDKSRLCGEQRQCEHPTALAYDSARKRPV